jgi:DNA primase
MARAAQYYKDKLKHSPRAIEYCKKRGLTGEVAARFGIGYAPDGWQNLQDRLPGLR